MHRFNLIFSSERVVIEHVMGLLKNRWSSLRGIRTQLRKKGDLKKINRWILCFIILHNFMIDCEDDWDPIDAQDLFQPVYSDFNPNETGHDFRETMKQIVLVL